jgi:hypothetical protein
MLVSDRLEWFPWNGGWEEAKVETETGMETKFAGEPLPRPEVIL